LKEIQTGTICSLPDFMQGWGGYFIGILFQSKNEVINSVCYTIEKSSQYKNK